MVAFTFFGCSYKWSKSNSGVNLKWPPGSKNFKSLLAVGQQLVRDASEYQLHRMLSEVGWPTVRLCQIRYQLGPNETDPVSLTQEIVLMHCEINCILKSNSIFQ